ncbi:MAG: hypothetical protein U9R66_14900 [Thermodesulfobacteriota bacterium]|nr:hypothetical protein [Thermodesulfobacteriota bacterium]
MGAVKSLPGLQEPDKLTTRYGGVPVVYVESEEDQYVFGECWFKEHLSKIEFKPAKAKCDSDGCNAVLKAVREERQAGNPAWGVVDRDILMANDRWNFVHETNDELYERAQPFGNTIKVLCRWEMESYLVDVEALENVKASSKMEPERPLAEVTQELVDHCHVLVPHAAINAVLHLHKIKGLGDGYTNRFNTPDDVNTDIHQKHIPRLPGNGLADYDKHLSLVSAFDLPEDALESQLNALLRRIHGKALLERFFHASHKIQVDTRGLLANRIKEKSRIPQEIKEFVEHVTTS